MSRLYGLQRVWPRDGDHVGGHLVDVLNEDSIIAIHGLGTQSPRTWLAYESHTGSRLPRSVNWLADDDMLPARFPNSYIWTYDWDGDYCVDASVETLLGQGQGFLRAIKSKVVGRNGIQPFIIIASCFGGIIASKAVQIAVLHQAEFRSTLLSLAGIIFLASPLKGTRMKKALDWHILISTLMGKQVSDRLYKDLDAKTDVLEDLAHSFTLSANGGWETWYRIPLFCFYETKSTQVLKAVLGSWVKRIGSGKRMLVPKESATLDGVDNQGLISNHPMMSKFRGPEDPNFEAMTVRLGKLVENIPNLISARSDRAKINVYSTLPWAVNPLFSGRDNMVDKIVKAFQREQPGPGRRKVFVITGEGGVGKSELSLQIAHKMQDKIWGTFWVDGSSKSVAEAGYLSAVNELGRDATTMEEALRRLSLVKEEWLLMLDNADDIHTNYHDFLPPGQNGSVIITSRNPDCRHHQTIGTEHLGGLEQRSASELLLRAADIENDKWNSEMEGAMAISQLLSGHPLAILQAGAYIKQFCTVAEYPVIFRSRPQQQMAFGLVQGQSRFVHIQGTFDVSVDALERTEDGTARDAKDLLKLLSMLHFSNLPLEAFKAVSNDMAGTSAEVTFLGGITPAMSAATPKIFSYDPKFWDNENLLKATSTLRSLALISVGTRHGLKSLSMHPLVHTWAYSRFTSNSPNSIDPRWLAAGTFLSRVSRGTNRWIGWEMDIRSHLHSFLSRMPSIDLCKRNHPTAPSILYQCARLLHQARDDRMVEKVLRQIFVILDADEKVPVPSLLPLYELRAGNDVACGRRKDAMILYKQIIDLRRTQFGDEDPGCLESRYAYAIAARGTGDLETARSELEDVVSKRKALFGEAYLGFIVAQRELARVLALQGDGIDKSIALLEQVVRISSSTLPSHDPVSLKSRHEMARVYLKSSRRAGFGAHCQEAIRILKEVQSQEQEILAEDDRQRLSTLHGLAKAYIHNNQIEEAKKLLLEIATIQDDTLEPGHPTRLATLFELGRAYRLAKQPEHSVRVLEEAVKYYEVLSSAPNLGPLPYYKIELAQSLLEVGEVEKARELAEHVYQIQREHLPQGHEDIRACEELLEKIGSAKSSPRGVV